METPKNLTHVFPHLFIVLALECTYVYPHRRVFVPCKSNVLRERVVDESEGYRMVDAEIWYVMNILLKFIFHVRLHFILRIWKDFLKNMNGRGWRVEMMRKTEKLNLFIFSFWFDSLLWTSNNHNKVNLSCHKIIYFKFLTFIYDQHNKYQWKLVRESKEWRII